MKYRPILFSGEMVRAILEGRKTQTRRVLLKAPALYGAPGDRLWVRETFYVDQVDLLSGRLPKTRPSDLGGGIYYRADGECCEQIPECCCAEVGKPRWRPSIHMPRWASRLTLEVTGVRVERLQDITVEDARAEGVTPTNAPTDSRYWRGAFRDLWDSINAKRGYGWDSNPWVWAVSFELLTD